MSESPYRLGAEGDRLLSTVAHDSSPIVQALRYGITAPSAHNTQPWRIEVVSDTEARVYFEPARLLPVTDPPGRQVHISHGTLAEMTSIAASHLGYSTEVDVLPEGEMTLAEYGTKPTVVLRLVTDSGLPEDPLFAQIRRRRSSRLQHTAQLVSDQERALIEAAATRPGVQPGWIGDQQMAEVIECAAEAMAVETNDYSTFEETNQWFRFNDAEIANKADGLNLDSAGMSGLVLIFARWTTRPRNWHSRLNRSGYLATFSKTVRETRALFTLTTPTNTMSDWITTGRAYVRAQLTAASYDLRFHPLSQSLQEFPQMNQLRARMDALVGVAPPAKLQMLIRVGHTRVPALSPRRELRAMLRAR